MTECPNGQQTDRVNPFDQDTDEFARDVAVAYNTHISSSTHSSSHIPSSSLGFPTDLLEDFFDEPLINVNENSSISEIENAVLKCKHMFLASSADSEPRKQRLLDRLIELRRILQCAKEISFSSIDSGGSSHIGGSSSHSPGPDTGSPSPYSSVVSNNGESYQPSRNVLLCGGHDFQLISSIRHLGKPCERCTRLIRDPSRRVLSCRLCGILCHPDFCLRGLTRRCPGSSTSLDSKFSFIPFLPKHTPIIDSGSRKRTESYSENSLSSAAPTQDNRLHFPFRHLEVHQIAFIGSNLSRQGWACVECQKPIAPAPNNVVLPETSLISSILQKANTAIEAGVNLLTSEATEDSSTEEPSIKIMTPQVSSQIPSLSGYLNRLTSPDPALIEFSHLKKNTFQWAFSDFRAELGPIQTWADARVLEAYNKLRRSTNISSLGLQNGQLTFQCSNTNLAQSSDSQTSNYEPLDQARLCYYSGRFYCHKCHWGDTYQIPACIFVMKDYKPKPVSRTALLWLTYSRSRHLFRVPESWYRYESHARRVCCLRLRIFRARPYFEICTEAKTIKSEFEKTHPYWILDQPYTCTMELVSQILDGSLANILTNFLEKLNDHVLSCQTCDTYIPNSCVVCQQSPIKPYQMKQTLCFKCNKACHRSCLCNPLPEFLPETINNTHVDETQTYQASDPDQLKNEWIEVLYPALGTICRCCANNTDNL